MRYEYQKLKDFGTQVLIRAGLEPDEAELCAENLLFADSRGLGSHGFSRLAVYAQRLECGVVAHGVNAEVVQVVGRTFVLYRRNEKEPVITLPR